MWLAWETGVLDVLLPELSSYLADAADDDSVWRLLSEVDRRTKLDDKPLDDVLLWAVLLLEPLSEACSFGDDPVRGANDFLEPVVERLNLPRRIADAVRRIVALLPRVEHGRGDRFKKNALYPLTVELADLRRSAQAPRAIAPLPEDRPRRKRKKTSRTTSS
jgi:poly(A) polymerase